MSTENPIASPQAATPEAPRERLAYIALGSNLPGHDNNGGSRALHIHNAITQLQRRLGDLVSKSENYETKPVGFESDNDFMNAVACFRTTLDPEEIMAVLEEVEVCCGRTRKTDEEGYHDRAIDLDLLYLGDMVYHSDKLTIPHPRMHDRWFVLRPLLEIAPSVEHPVLHLTTRQMLARITNVQPTLLTPDKDGYQHHEVELINHLLYQLSSNPKPIDEARLHELLTDPHTRIYVVKNAYDEICGMATLSLCPLVTGTKAWVEDVVVDEEYRGIGLGRLLLNHLISEARAMGVKSLNLTSRPERASANRLYRSLGFEQRNTNVYKMAF